VQKYFRHQDTKINFYKQFSFVSLCLGGHFSGLFGLGVVQLTLVATLELTLALLI
jgi:hypothetical protein